MFNLNLNDIKNNLQNIENKVKDIEGASNISIKELFNEQFLKKYTQFSSVEEMFSKSGFTVNSLEDLKAIPQEELNKFISGNSNFASWKEMLETAFGEITKNKLFG